MREDGLQEEKEEVGFDIDLDQVPKASSIQDMHQEGNYLVGTTNTGTKFRQHIPQGKILNKVDGQYILENIRVTAQKV
jgi:hypothetical protein